MTSEQQAPPWVWDGLSDELHEETWRRFAEWVSWLTEAYAPWVMVPDCWPVHEGLRVELAMFWYWHRLLMTASANPVDGVRWHAELRRAAISWRELAGCQHEPPVRHREAIAEQRRTRTAQFLAAASARPKGTGQR